MNDLAAAYLFSFSRKAADITALHLGEYVRAFLAWFSAQGGACASDLTPEILTRYFAERRARWKAATAAHHRWAVKGFVTYLYREGYLLVNPWPEDFKFRPVRPPARRIPSPAEALAHIRKRGSSRINVALRNRAVFELAYGCGLRKCELMRLNLSDVGKDSLHIKGKGGKERLVPIGRETQRHLIRYIEIERPQLAAKCPQEEALFLSFHGGRLGDSGYEWLTHRFRDPKCPITLQTLRHACATHMLQGGAPLPVIQKLLGHERLSTTSIYTHVDLKELKGVLKRCHPRK